MKLLLLLLFASTFGFSQTLYKSNVSENGMPIPGVTICVKNTSRCTTSDFDGNYAIKVNKGDELVLSYIGMTTKTIKITNLPPQENYEKVDRIVANDYAEKLKKPIDSVQISKPSGNFDLNSLFNLENEISKITRKEGFYHFKNKYEHHKLALEFNQEFSFSSPIRLPKYQDKFAQGRSQAGQILYQSPETNEIFSFGPNVSSLEYSGNNSEYYPQGNIVNQSFGNGNPLQLYNPNDFFQNTTDNKSSINAVIQSPKGNFLKMNFLYKTGNISIPTSRNNEIATFVKYFRNISQNSKIETLLSYNDFENNLSNSNFGINKIVFANAVTPIHFHNNLGSTLANGFQRSYSAFENNPYYLIDKNLDQNKSKTISFNFNHRYQKNVNSNVANTSFQSSEITNTNAQNPFFAGIVAPNYNERIEKFKSFSVSDVFSHRFNYKVAIESKIDFRLQERRLERIFFNGFASPNDFPNTSSIQNKLDVSQERFEVFYNLNGSYVFDNVFSNYEDLTLKLSSDLNYSSTVKGSLMTNFFASADIRRLFIDEISFSISQSFNQVEPSLQNNNLNFNSLQYQVSQFKQLQNNLELLTPKDAIPTNEATTNLGLMYNFDYRWNFKANYYYKNVENLYAPILTANEANWSPEVNYKQNGFEFEIERFSNFDSNFGYNLNLNLTTFRNEVTSLNNNQTQIAFAGFSDVNKNYIVGQPLGVIVGTGYLRDANHNVIIDEQGFPIEDSQPKVLGNPNPDFVVGFFNSFRYKKFTLNLSFDWSQGGEIWNGTQQTLNYYGKSETTGNQRNISNYIFEGVTQSGVSNTQAVSFYDANLPVEQNRWTRYGIDGVAEDAIEDATYFRLNSISLSYSNGVDYLKDKLNFTISFFVNNVFILSKSKSVFSNNSMFNSIETNGLEYFNAPMMRSFGSSLTIKF
ncbi:hypothetical protein J2X31_001600 [Flavobacterium arsenatis]|uniref:TonB-dependent receptor n=1 Tax=Flavobacterium arsenatis TaxID=1484332 RepID=A0ABU1TNP9_9FLAO|nr:carboxypeptidase-like regulatory domain-containing protein [Flavobacterium arsenatis]MDR6967588.1 hypothetical protein [Flavobacterium arsenatis]